MTLENLEEATKLQEEIRLTRATLVQLGSPDGLNRIAILANNKTFESQITSQKDLKDIGSFIEGYLESRLTELEKQFNEL